MTSPQIAAAAASTRTPDDVLAERMARHNQRVVNTIVGLFSKPSAPGISDADMDDERRAQKILFAALAEFKSKCQDAAALSGLCKTDIQEMLTATADYAPTPSYWDERISVARRG